MTRIFLIESIKKIVSQNLFLSYLVILFAKILESIFKPTLIREFRGYLDKSATVETVSESKAPKKIMMVIGSLGPGGAERQLTLLSNALARLTSGSDELQSFKVIIACIKCSTAPNDFFRNQLSSKVEVVDLSLYDGEYILESIDIALTSHWWFKSSAVNFKKLLALINIENPDIVHGWLDETAVLAGLAAVRSGVPKVILSTRNVNPSHFRIARFMLARPFFRYGLKLLSLENSVILMNNSNVGARDYENWLALERGSIKTVYNGFDMKSFDKIHEKKNFSSEDTLTVGSVFRFSLEKNPKLWIEVAAMVSKKIPQARFVLVGEGHLESKIKFWVENLGLTKVVCIMPPTASVYEIVSSFDLFLLTSKFEGLPNVLIEAQALGIPVVSTDAGGAKETFINKKSGVLVDSEKPEDIAMSVIELLENFRMREKYGEFGKAWVSSNFSQEKMVAKHLNLYFNSSTINHAK